ncbi:argininosuccinate lyase [Candidatus Woesearchaeota archaeon]|nr:MAG: argininosuccinate lyase [Candidatus Woesearchaeota archaeon]
MAKLWDKGKKIDKKIVDFTTGNDFLLDQKLVKYDCLASIAHAKMLRKIGVLSKTDLEKAVKGLKEIIRLDKKGKFEINQEDEDCHTAIENYLTKNYGEVGKKIHAGRSRNDQVLVALRLYEKDELAEINELINELVNAIEKFIKANGSVQIPGYTHMQPAMPTTIGTWLGSFITALKDDAELLETAFKLIDQSPLGSAAGFGVPVLNVDREMTAKELGFFKVMDNPMYAQLSRGKIESTVLHLLTQVMFDLNKLSSDLMLFNMKEFNFIELPEEVCTGSSIMPQKKNPDVLELIRAKYHVVVAEEMKIKGIISNLISGYNRDLQLTKEPLIKSIEITKECLEIMCELINSLKINQEKCRKAMKPELFATEEAYKLVKKCVPFREAYKKVGKKYFK